MIHLLFQIVGVIAVVVLVGVLGWAGLVAWIDSVSGKRR